MTLHKKAEEVAKEVAEELSTHWPGCEFEPDEIAVIVSKALVAFAEAQTKDEKEENARLRSSLAKACFVMEISKITEARNAAYEECAKIAENAISFIPGTGVIADSDVAKAHKLIVEIVVAIRALKEAK